MNARFQAGSWSDSRERGLPRKVEESIVYMRQHLDETLQVVTLATRAKLSKSHFSFLFKSYVGFSPFHYFTRLRLQHACHLLKDTEMTVTAIAHSLGYDDPYYFSRIFKSVHRIAPSHYRQLLCQNSTKNVRALNP